MLLVLLSSSLAALFSQGHSFLAQYGWRAHAVIGPLPHEGMCYNALFSVMEI